VHLGQNILRTVVFLGYTDPSSPTGFKCAGTGFLVHHETEGYLLTAKHIADNLGADPFQVRLNANGGAFALPMDNVKWATHTDKFVDLAAVPLRLSGQHGFEAEYLKADETVLTTKRLELEDINVGDLAYTVGLFHFVHGQSRNLPIVYSGNVSLMPPPGEKIPMGDGKGGTEWVEAILVESGAIDGASGSPVFVRGAITWPDLETVSGKRSALLSETKIYLLGLLQGAWLLPPDDPLRMTVQAKVGDVVPVGFGVVVPGQKIMELLDGAELRARRTAASHFGIARKLASTGSQTIATES